ncbi:MAG: histidine kinase dimerization/phosphoacceptor domain -containing protein, partial [Pseudomonadota bacterium]
SGCGHFTHAYFLGSALPKLEDEITAFSKRLQLLNQEPLLRQTNVYHQTFLNLRGKSGTPTVLTGELMDEDELLRLFTEAGDKSKVVHLCLNKLILCYLFRHYDRGLEAARPAEECLVGMRGTYATALFYFYDSLLLLAGRAAGAGSSAVLKKTAANQKKMKLWARHAPMNFRHKFQLVEAERLRVTGRDAEAADAFDRSIKQAHAGGYVNEEALANELAAAFHLSRGKVKLAAAYALDALGCYEAWGARAKVVDLKEVFKGPLKEISAALDSGTLSIGSTISKVLGDMEEGLDLASVMRATRSISGEIQFDGLRRTLMTTIAESSGAERAVLLLRSGDRMMVYGQEPVPDTADASFVPVPLDETSAVPRAVVNYVIRTNETLISDEVASDPRFADDPYVIANAPRSVLCLPIIRQMQLVGVFYLENRFIPGIFARGRVAMLQMLCAQAAISIENSRLYGQIEDYSRSLEQKVAERTEELTRANADLTEEIRIRELVQEALRVSRETLELALTGSDVGMWDLNVVKGEAVFSPRWADMLGYAEEEIGNGPDWWRSLVHPEDIGSFEEWLDSHLNGPRPRAELEHRLRTKSEDWKWVLIRGKVTERGAGGGPTRMSGTSLDITDRKHAEQKLMAALREKEVLLREVHHRVKNNLAVVTGFLRLQSRLTNDEKVREMFQAAQSRVNSLNILHEKMYESENIADLKAKDYLKSLLDSLFGLYHNVGTPVSLISDIADIPLGIEKAIPIGFIVTELFSNAMKHAFPPGTRGQVTVSLQPQGDGEFVLSVIDNGVGLPAEAIAAQSKSLGLRLVNTFTRQLHGELEVVPGNGTAFRIRFSGR